MSEHALAAKQIRTKLKAAFPGIKFCVTSESYAGGNSVRVAYQDGPPQEKVHSIVGEHQGGSFDGMTDMYSYDNGNPNISQVKYAFTNRSISQEIKAAAKIKIAKDFGIVNIDDENEWQSKTNQWSDMCVYRELQDKTLEL